MPWTGRLCFLCAAMCQTTLAQAELPNVVMIVSDDQSWGDYGFMGHPHLQTPHLDKLAAQSLTFTRGYVPDSLCRPSLATILTGRYPHQHGIVGNDPPPPAPLAALSPQELRTHPDYLQQRLNYLSHMEHAETVVDRLCTESSYLAFQSGKWWEGNYASGGFTHGMTHGDITRGGRHGDQGLKIGREGLQPIFDFIDHAQVEQKPFFVWYAPLLPHAPHTPPEGILEKYHDKTPHLPVARYWAMCEWFDETVGELLDFLDQQSLSDDTLVIYVTDNGWITLEDSGHFAPKSKRSQYDGGVRTPIMIRWPGRVEPRLNRQDLASSIDLAPTLLAAAGLPPSPELPGINLLDGSAVTNRKTIYGEIFEHDIQDMTDPVASLRFRWIIDGEWKLIVPHPGREPDAPIELYRITQDDEEERNAARDYPHVVEQLVAKLNTWWNPDVTN